MRLFLVLLSIAVALALWVWATGPGTSLLVAAGGWIFCAIVGRITYVLLKPRIEDLNSAPPPSRQPADSTVIRPRRQNRP
ncbi:hypothetical protein [Roseomonas marmotae]|uniref:Uncharacterized protein n=1 Tax=Roseomonas marmotae TaxID=2768161 RepID=A0ABS3KBG6_9PROT|nr:hypothetical protein [Roseomonas marmotae]MBO1074787.1 hypothetical protein [Roseomonas marmotae]QTI80704.1 hypothetical protein IAI58_08265 [Roseomonas marmotae]